jgi:hypothetical protein
MTDIMISRLSIPDDVDEQSAQLFGTYPGVDIGLVLDADHPASRFGRGKLLKSGSDEVLTGETFRLLRDSLGAYIITTHPRRVADALGIDRNEPGIETGPQNSVFACAEG